MGLWLVFFIVEHLVTNSQAALWLSEGGQGFVRSVNQLHNLPYLEAIELTLIGVPILIHLVWGIQYALNAKMNHRKSDGSVPSIQTPRNRAYSWQRITSWILLVCLIGHIVKFRFLEYPEEVKIHHNSYYTVKITLDGKLDQVAEKLKVTLVGPKRASVEDFKMLNTSMLSEQEVLAVAPDFGTATILSVRNTFKSPIYIGIYTIFVLAACFHAFNGFWTFLITWGLVLKMAAQRTWSIVAVCLMVLFIFLGLAAVWGSYLVQ